MRRSLARVLVVVESLGLGAAFVGASAAGVLFHVDTAASKRVIAKTASRALAGVLEGTVTIDRLERIALGRRARVRISSVTVRDPSGKVVIVARDVDATIDLDRLIDALLRGGAPDVIIPDAYIASADVILDMSEDGNVAIAKAFDIRPTPPSPSKGSPHLAIGRARLGHAWVRGNVVPGMLDADVDAAEATVTFERGTIAVDVSRGHVKLRSPHALGLPKLGAPFTADINGVLTLGPDARYPSGSVDLRGDLEGLAVIAHAKVDGAKLDATIDVPRALPVVLARVLPQVSISQPVEFHATIEGTIPITPKDDGILRVDGRGRIGEGLATVGGFVDLRTSAFDAKVSATQLDARAFGGPASELAGTVQAKGKIIAGPAGTFAVATMKGRIAGEEIPPLVAEGTFDPARVKATLRAEDRGARANGTIDLDVATLRAAFNVRVRDDDIRVITRGQASGSATVRAFGTIDLARGAIDGHATVDADGLAKDPVAIDHAHAEARLNGPLGAPIIDVVGNATGVRVTSPGKEPLVYTTATASARISVAPTPRILDAKVELATSGAPVIATARQIDLAGGHVAIRDARVDGLGAPLELDAHTTPGGWAIRAKGHRIELGRISALTGIRELALVPGARADIDVDVVAEAHRMDGHVDITVDAEPSKLTAEVHARLSGRHITLQARAAEGGAAWAEIHRAELEFSGAPTLANAKRITGFADLRGRVDLGQKASVFSRYFEKLAGTATFDGRVDRGDPDLPPAVALTAHTSGFEASLVADPKADPAAPQTSMPKRIAGLDGSIHVSYDGATDDAEVSLVTWDKHGTVASANGKARIPAIAWATGTREISEADIARLVVSAIVDIPKRKVETLPDSVGLVKLSGQVSARATLEGLLARPNANIVVMTDDLRAKTFVRRVDHYAPVDSRVDARWDGEDFVIVAQADESAITGKARRKTRSVSHVRGLVLGKLRALDVLHGNAADTWTASAELDTENLELGPLPLPFNTTGKVTGRFRTKRLNESPSIEGRAHVDALTIAGVETTSADVTLGGRDGSLFAAVHVDQKDGGKADVRIASRALVWKRLDVGWEAQTATRIDYDVAAMRLALLSPLVGRAVRDLDGRLDGRGTALVDAEHQVFEGGLALSDGRVYVAALGEELTGVSAKARFDKSGQLFVDDGRGRVGAGTFLAAAAARFHGLAFVAANANIVVPSKDGVPISAEGATFAEATGEVQLEAKMAPDGHGLIVNAAIPRAHVSVPDRTTQAIQQLDPDAKIAIGIRGHDGTLVAPPTRPRRNRATTKSDGTPAPERVTRVSVVLGDDVVVAGRGMRIQLTGKTLVEIANEVKVTGRIDLSNGTIDVQGRKFVIDHGSVTFSDGEAPDNPTIVTTAYWDAPDPKARTRIWVDFTGPLKTGKMTLRSEPPYSKSEILAYLLFGRPDPNVAAPKGGGSTGATDAARAASMSAGAVAAGLNQALGDLSDDIEFGTDTTRYNRAVQKIDWKIRRNLRVSLGYAAAGGATSAADRGDTKLLFVNWQFIPRWSLVGTAGDKGTSILDVVFQLRY